MNFKNDFISIRPLCTIKMNNFPRLHAMLSCLFFSFFFFSFILCALICFSICFFSAFPILIILQRPGEMLFILQIFSEHSADLLLYLWTSNPLGTFVLTTVYYISSVQFSHSVLSSALRLHGLQHSRLPYPTPNPRTYLNSCS